MRDMELVVRYIGFSQFLPSYRGNLKRFLDRVCQRGNTNWPEQQDRYQAEFELFEKSLGTLIRVFGEDEVARKWDAKRGRFRGPINRAILDTHLFYLRETGVREFYLNRPDIVLDLARSVSEDPDYLRAVEATTKSISSVVDRLRIWGQALERGGIGLQLPKPTWTDGQPIRIG
jgi:hypothetical protein